MQIFTIDGARFDSLEGFYDEIGRALISGASWGRNLDGLNDILRGGFGTPEGGFTLRWQNVALSRQRLGYEETVRQLKDRLQKCHPSNRAAVQQMIGEAEHHQGEMVFDWLVAMIRIHGPGGAEASDTVILELHE